MRRQSEQRGFTLIELMVVIVILAVLATLGIPSFMEMIQNMQVRTAAESILDGMQIARSEAVRRNAHTQFVLGPGTGWTVIEINPPTSGTACSTIGTIQTRSSAEGSEKATVATSPAGATVVTFTPTGWTSINCTGANPIAQINVGSSVLDSTQERPLEIRVTASGGIRMCAPWAEEPAGLDLNPPASRSNWKLPAGDPRRC